MAVLVNCLLHLLGDCLEKQMHSSLFCPVVDLVVELLRHPGFQLHPLERRCLFPVLVMDPGLPHRQVPPPASHA